MQINGDDELIAHPRAATSPRARTSSWPGPTACSRPSPPPGDDATWFPNLYDDLTWTGPNKEKGGEVTIFQTPSPLLKYDQLFSTSARSWEAANSQNKDISRWPGHCLGGAVASILLNEPIPAPGSGHDQGRAQGALGRAGREPLQPPDRRLRQRDPRRARPGPASTRPTGRPRASTPCSRPTSGASRRPCSATCGPSRPAARSTRSGTRGSTSTSPSTRRSPAAGHAPSGIKIEVHTNSGSMLNGQDDKDRVINYEYSLVYGLDGRVDETNPAAADWISVGGEALFAPLNILEVVESRWAGHNPYVTEANVRADRPGQRRRRRPVRLGPAAVPPGRPVRGRPLGGQQSFDVCQRQRATRPRVAAASSGPSSAAESRPDRRRSALPQLHHILRNASLGHRPIPPPIELRGGIGRFRCARRRHASPVSSGQDQLAARPRWTVVLAGAPPSFPFRYFRHRCSSSPGLRSINKGERAELAARGTSGVADILGDGPASDRDAS